VTGEFLDHVAAGVLPEREVSTMLARFYTTTRALAMASS
jgi:hypothetical protein